MMHHKNNLGRIRQNELIKLFRRIHPILNYYLRYFNHKPITKTNFFK